MIAFDSACPSDEAAIRELLRASDLPTDDLPPGFFDRFAVARFEGRVVGVAGFEMEEAIAMARSLAVSPAFRKEGIASSLLTAIEERAASRGGSVIYGLTLTAEVFLTTRGYERIERSDAPDEIARTFEFTELCPESAVLMRKVLNQMD
ncbi:GNAT family N-acetyltransferase [Candidatus Bipolaricaulota bacterium]|nr:GNAT family N-acetyltransferase [Candidatus Bipolaricaulota bacterium]